MSLPVVYWFPKTWAFPTRDVLPPDSNLKTLFRKFLFKKAKYNQLGLYHDDLLYLYPDVAEAVRRLPMQIKEERDWRTIRAVQLDIKNIVLPENEWHSWEEDISKGRYLEPYLEEVRKEIKEQNEWRSTH